MNKKKRLVVLVVIYIIVLIFTLSMECYGIREMVTRAVVNISTLAMALLCLGISLILSKGNPQRDEKESKESDEVTEDEPTLKDVSDCVWLEQPDQGGHVGFPTGRFPGRIDYMPKRVMKFFDDLQNSHKS